MITGGKVIACARRMANVMNLVVLLVFPVCRTDPGSLQMQLGMIGLGRMGANMVRRLMRGGHTCVVHDTAPAAVQALTGEGAIGATTLDDFVARLRPPPDA